MTNIGVVFRKWRAMEERQMRDVAKEIGISASTLCRLEGGKMVDAPTLLKIMNWLMTAAKPRQGDER